MATRRCFAKVCVELNLEQPLVPIVFIGGVWRHVEYEGILGVCSGCGRVNHRIGNCTEVVVLVTTGAENVGVAKNMAMEKTVSNTITRNRFESLQVEDSIIIKVDKDSVRFGKRISSISRPMGPRDKESMVFDASDQILVVESQVPNISSTEVPVLPMIDNVGGGVVAIFFNEPKPPDPIAGDIIVCEKPLVISKVLANKVDYAVNDVVLSETDDDISNDNGDCGGQRPMMIFQMIMKIVVIEDR
ncbi:hypothetical protein K2173_006787 [Erythroxylum novogranatense]|uniref:Uncharacterized protein n=1 Tax=Erythroxylum novogranatense TaxID=1862640 RepID=A0AAV8SXR6_9ROSI|nr:hypothetical protein K2173_006787 [Erythroxylum novogranatense]